MSKAIRRRVGFLLRQLQAGMTLTMPTSRPMPSVGRRCHELRVSDDNTTWRVVYFLDADAVVVLHVFRKTTQRTPKQAIKVAATRLAKYRAAAG